MKRSPLSFLFEHKPKAHHSLSAIEVLLAPCKFYSAVAYKLSSLSKWQINSISSRLTLTTKLCVYKHNRLHCSRSAHDWWSHRQTDRHLLCDQLFRPLWTSSFFLQKLQFKLNCSLIRFGRHSQHFCGFFWNPKFKFAVKHFCASPAKHWFNKSFNKSTRVFWCIFADLCI